MFSMDDLKIVHHSSISYSSIKPSDLEALKKIHCDLFPIRYESEFFHSVVNGHNIVSWGAVDRSQSNGKNDLIEFVTTRIVPAKGSEIEDLLRFDFLKTDQALIYVLTLGVVESYRNFGITSSLVGEVIKYSSSIPMCQAVYLHVISHNNPAFHLYQKMSFQCVRRLNGFYFINGQHYDSFLFVFYLNGGRSPCSPLIADDIKAVPRVPNLISCSFCRELATLIATYLKNGLKLVAAKAMEWQREGL